MNQAVLTYQESLRVQETFQSTIQGEGYHCGKVVDFIRLSGCPVGCFFCDTGYSESSPIKPSGILTTIDKLVDEIVSPRVVISGGEPFIQPKLNLLIQALHDKGLSVSIETSGAKFHSVNQNTWITLSPKMHLNPNYPVSEDCWLRADEVKIVISDGSELDFYQFALKKYRPKHVYLQPEWETRASTIPRVLELLQRHPQYRFSAQLHKYINVR